MKIDLRKQEAHFFWWWLLLETVPVLWIVVFLHETGISERSLQAVVNEPTFFIFHFAVFPAAMAFFAATYRNLDICVRERALRAKWTFRLVFGVRDEKMSAQIKALAASASFAYGAMFSVISAFVFIPVAYYRQRNTALEAIGQVIAVMSPLLAALPLSRIFG